MGNVAQGNDESATDQHSQQVHADRAPDALALLMTRSSFDTFRQMDANLGGGYTRPIYQAGGTDILGTGCALLAASDQPSAVYPH